MARLHEQIGPREVARTEGGSLWTADLSFLQADGETVDVQVHADDHETVMVYARAICQRLTGLGDITTVPS